MKPSRVFSRSLCQKVYVLIPLLRMMIHEKRDFKEVIVISTTLTRLLHRSPTNAEEVIDVHWQGLQIRFPTDSEEVRVI